MTLNLRGCFDDRGNLKVDPYRFYEEDATPTQQMMHEMMFDDSGYVRDVTTLRKVINDNIDKWGWVCDAVGLYHAQILANATKGSYSTKYYFR